jgi:hypothetical protein
VDLLLFSLSFVRTKESLAKEGRRRLAFEVALRLRNAGVGFARAAGEMNFAPTTCVETSENEVFEGGGRNEFRPYNVGGNV